MTELLPERRQTGPATNLYRLYDENDILLYVGITTKGAGRLEQHADTKPWWPLVERVAVQHERRRFFESTRNGRRWKSYPVTELDELKAILNEFPVFNIKGVSWRMRQPSNRDPRKESLINRAEIEGAVSRLADSEVAGRLAVLERTEPQVYRRAHRHSVRVVHQELTELTLDREALIFAEERYFEDALDVMSVLQACEDFGGDPADYPYVRHRRHPYRESRWPAMRDRMDQRSDAKTAERLAEIEARQVAAGELD